MKTVVLATGSRGWSDRGAVESILLDTFDTFGAFTLVHGDNARGVDSIADMWGMDNIHLGVEVYRVPVTSHDWNTHGLSAGPRRNEDMVSRVLEMKEVGWHAECLAFLLPCTKPGCRRPQPHHTHGGDHCASLAKALGVITTIYTESDFQ